MRIAELERINRLDPLEVFTVYDGQVVEKGDLVASVKVAPHLVDAGVIEAGARIAGSAASPSCRSSPFVARRVGVVVKETVRATASERFEASVRARSRGSGRRSSTSSTSTTPTRSRRRSAGSRAVPRRPMRCSPPAPPDRPGGCLLRGDRRAGRRVVRRGVLRIRLDAVAGIGGTSILGLPTCGAYSKATAADLLLPRLLAGEPASEATVAKLGHGGILTRDQRFRFPRYARELDAPEGQGGTEAHGCRETSREPSRMRDRT